VNDTSGWNETHFAYVYESIGQEYDQYAFRMRNDRRTEGKTESMIPGDHHHIKYDTVFLDQIPYPDAH
jgi:hypothetical protein